MTHHTERDEVTQLRPGQIAPDFSLPTQDGDTIKLSSLASQADCGVIVYFYPKAATPGCTTEACDFRDNLATLSAFGYQLIGVSTDPLEDLRDFAAAQALSFPLASDADHEVADAYGTWGPKTVNGMETVGVRRSTFVIDTDRTITAAEYDVDPQGHVAALRARLAK